MEPSRCSAAVRVWLNSAKASTRGVDLPRGRASGFSKSTPRVDAAPSVRGALPPAHRLIHAGAGVELDAHVAQGGVVQHFLADLRPDRVQLARAVDRQRLPGQPDPAGDTGLAGQGAGQIGLEALQRGGIRVGVAARVG